VGSEDKCPVLSGVISLTKVDEKIISLKVKGKVAGLKVGLKEKKVFKNIWGLALLSLMPD